MYKCTQQNYHKYLDQLTRDQRKVLKANPGLEHRVVNAVLNTGRTFRCTQCQKLILDLSGYFQVITCSPECRAKGKGHFAGKKRPEHSARMKVVMREVIASGRAWGPEHRANNQKHMQALNAKLTKELRRTQRVSIKSKRAQLRNALAQEHEYTKSSYFKKSRLASLTPEDVSSLTDAKVRSLMTEVNSCKTLFAMDNNPNMGSTAFYKRTKMKGLTKCYRRKTITVRSDLEYNFVLWLEAHAKRWTYEWVKLPYTDSGNTYTPDFKVQLADGKVWVVETKGFYTEKSFPRERKKMLVAAAWARAKGYRLALLSAKQIGKRGKFVAVDSWIDLTSLTDRQIDRHMKSQIPGGKTC